VGELLGTSPRLSFYFSLEHQLVDGKEQVRLQLLKGSLQTFRKTPSVEGTLRQPGCIMLR